MCPWLSAPVLPLKSFPKRFLGLQHLRIFTNKLNIAMLAFTNPTLIFCDQAPPPAILEQSGAQLLVCKGERFP
ncbi:MAG: hypothetical protein QNK41_18205 [Desulfosarcina sp.]|nr:hypothetical protein [Desulfosarcina sp.]